MNLLEGLKNHSVVVADSSDFESVTFYEPQDATTNPSLILQASYKEQYFPLLKDAVLFGEKAPTVEMRKVLSADKLFVNFGMELLKRIPGRVSVEVDARLSFNVEKSYERAKHLIYLFEKENIPRERILIKLASTYEGIEAAKRLEKEGIHCNLTLLFSLMQAAFCAEADVTLISPFVGRVLDWYKKNHIYYAENDFESYEGPGVMLVKIIYFYYKTHGYKTSVMGASFRNIEEVLELAGCDLLTIPPHLLEELKMKKGFVENRMETYCGQGLSKFVLSKDRFQKELKENRMLSEKLYEGIKKFSDDAFLLEKRLEEICSVF